MNTSKTVDNDISVRRNNKFDFGDNVEIIDNAFVINKVLPYNPEPGVEMYQYQTTNGWIINESDVQLIPIDETPVRKPIMTEDQIAEAVKGLIGFNASYIVKFHLGAVEVIEITNKKAQDIIDDHEFLNKQ